MCLTLVRHKTVQKLHMKINTGAIQNKCVFEIKSQGNIQALILTNREHGTHFVHRDFSRKQELRGVSL